MKTTFVSTQAMQSAVRLAVQRAQAEIADKQIEITTGRHNDIGLALGSKTARTISLTRDVARLDAMLDNNALVTQRLSVSQDALGQLSDNAQTMLETLITVSGSADTAQLNVAKREISAMLGSFVSLANTASSGEFLFAGVNTDVRPMEDYLAPGSPAKLAFDDAFFDTFGFAQDDPATATITADAMQSFLDDTVAPMFEGAAWNDNWSSASDMNMTSRIANSEVIESSTNANAGGFRQFAMTAVVGIELLGMTLSADTRAFLSDRTIQLAGGAISAVDAERAALGVSEARVAKADNALSAQKDIVSLYIGELEGVDPYETHTRMTTLLSQVEASYVLTARIQQLSLLNYL